MALRPHCECANTVRDRVCAVLAANGNKAPVCRRRFGTRLQKLTALKAVSPAPPWVCAAPLARWCGAGKRVTRRLRDVICQCIAPKMRLPRREFCQQARLNLRCANTRRFCHAYPIRAVRAPVSKEPQESTRGWGPSHSRRRPTRGRTRRGPASARRPSRLAKSKSAWRRAACIARITCRQAVRRAAVATRALAARVNL